MLNFCKDDDTAIRIGYKFYVSPPPWGIYKPDESNMPCGSNFALELTNNKGSIKNIQLIFLGLTLNQQSSESESINACVAKPSSIILHPIAIVLLYDI